MIITNKRIKKKLPIEITIAGTAVKEVESNKLLGVTIDYSLSFFRYCSDIQSSVNRKLYSIKRLF